MRSRFLLMMLLLGLAVVPVRGLELARDGKALCPIVISKEAIAPELTAAKELRSYLGRVTGARFAIRTEDEVSPKASQILVGPSQRLKGHFPGVDFASLASDEILIKSDGNRLLLAGGRPRGTLYAVYTLLEDTVGCRWWTGTESTIPRKPTLVIPRLNIRYAPKLRYREAFYRDPLEHPLFAARLKLNGHFYRIPPDFGGHYSIIGWCHTFYAWLPPARYFDAHPDWYSEIGGKRSANWGQICLTNEGACKEMTRVVLEKLRENPDAGIISVSQNDCHGRCECASCKALEEKEGSPSGPLIHFVNKVAEAVEKEFPNVLVETLAYQYTRKPPRHVRPRRNVVVRLCTIECSFTQTLEDEANCAFAEDLRGWSAIAPNLYIWDYVTNFANYILPHANLRVLAPNLRFFAANNAIGVFEQGDAATSVGDFVRLRTWLLAHLEWDPSQDPRKLIAQFMKGYYGPAAPYLMAYLDLVHDSAERARARIGCYHHNTSYLTLKEMNEAARLFDLAEKAVSGEPILARRVRRERLPLDHAWLLRWQELREVAEKEKLPFGGPADPVAACREFIRLARSWDARNYSEAQSFESYVPALKARFAPPPPSPEEFKKIPKEDLVDIQESRFTLYNPPAWVEIVDDPKASNGKAAKMPGSHTQWATQFFISPELAESCQGEWNCYLIVRIEPGAESGLAFRYGIYDNGSRREVVTMGASIESARDGAYHTYSLGSHKLRGSYYVWVAPPGSGDAVKEIYVDRILLVREKESGG